MFQLCYILVLNLSLCEQTSLVSSDHQNQHQDIWTVDSPAIPVRKGRCTSMRCGSAIVQNENQSIASGGRWLDRKISNLTEEAGGVSKAPLQAAPRCPWVSLKHHSEVHTGEMRRSTKNSNIDALLKIAQGWMTQQLIWVYFWLTNTSRLPFGFILLSCQRGSWSK